MNEEKKLIDEEIVKVLERCAKSEGCIGGVCYFYSAECEGIEPALDLINRQKAEIERLTEENGQLKGYNSGLEYELEIKQKQVDELKVYLASEKVCSKQDVKDTAKEILDEVSKHFGGRWLVELYKKYGLNWSVEVE